MRFERKVEVLRKEKHKGFETEAFLHDVKLLAEGEPFEYLMGKVLFASTVVDLSFRPMIPRKETEFWVEQALHSILGSKEYKENVERKNPLKVLDLFAGSGAVGLAALKHIPESKVTFIELDKKLAHQIELSCEQNSFLESRYEARTGDVFGDVSGEFDVIFAVPPYVPAHMKEEVMRELGKEPELAFFDKEGGYYFHKKVLEQVSNYVSKNGTLFLEFDITQRTGIEELLRQNRFFSYIFLQDPYGHEAAVAVKMSQKS